MCRKAPATRHKVEGKTVNTVEGNIELGADFEACRIFQKQADKELCVKRVLDILEKRESCK